MKFVLSLLTSLLLAASAAGGSVPGGEKPHRKLNIPSDAERKLSSAQRQVLYDAMYVDHVDHRRVFDAMASEGRRHLTVSDDAIGIGTSKQMYTKIDHAWTVKATTSSLDDDDGSLLSIDESGTMLFSSASAYASSLQVDSIIVGSHEGIWNEADVSSSALRDPESGIILCRLVTGVATQPDGTVLVSTDADTPLDFVDDIDMGVDIERFPTWLVPGSREGGGEGRHLAVTQYCADDCAYYLGSWTTPSYTVEGYDWRMDLCGGCAQISKSFDFLNFNYDTTSGGAAEEINIGNGIMCKDCWAHLGSFINFEVKVATSYYGTLSLTHAKASCGGNVGFNMDMEINDPAFNSWGSYKKVKAQDGEIPLGTFATLKVTGEASFPVSGTSSAKGSAKAGVGFSFDGEVGLQYDNPGAGFKVIAEMDVNYQPPYFTTTGFEVSTDFKVKVGVTPRAVLAITGTYFPFSYLTASTYLEANKWYEYKIDLERRRLGERRAEGGECPTGMAGTPLDTTTSGLDMSSGIEQVTLAGYSLFTSTKEDFDPIKEVSDMHSYGCSKITSAPSSAPAGPSLAPSAEPSGAPSGAPSAASDAPSAPPSGEPTSPSNAPS